MPLPCRHVIAYRKHAAVPSALIPLTRVDQRWTVPAVDLTEVNQLNTPISSQPRGSEHVSGSHRKDTERKFGLRASFQANSQTFRTTMSSTA
ncbi:uncharacterized protein IUM83_02120 [Phytophthora cinnamomi]|uniref:uncharacterized protein n=1 Tax=Phytophthora cinnamomi TaxID=4785 RepID=UPI00355A2E02|nr:hypothetical protein IUM83_02120 [Phytophthora cinnamomi]